MLESLSPVEIKASLLSQGTNISKEVLKSYGPPFLEKRRAYGNPDLLSMRGQTIPQEMYVDPEGEALITSVSVKENSPWLLDCHDGKYFLTHQDKHYPVDFPYRPEFYDYQLVTRKRVSQIITLYGGGSLGIFAYGQCQLVKINKPCHFCSISQNRDQGTDFENVISSEQVNEALALALRDTEANIRQVMLNGGNFPEMDKSFQHYAKLVRKAREQVKQSGRDVETHLIVYPPNDLGLIEELSDLDISVAMNTEVFDPDLFSKYCPGKVDTAGRDHIFAALEKAVDVLGEGRVYTIFVGGLEPLPSLAKGLNYVTNIGVVPVINVLHTDPETPLENFPNPSPQCIMEMGKLLQSTYSTLDIKPFYEDCGRNSIDTEARRKLFS